MKILGIIPARYASSRFPGKPLTDIDGKSMIRRVYEQAKKSSELCDVIVATDDDRIFSHVSEFGGKVMLTSDQHRSGTDRCAEVLNSYTDAVEAVINIQGDEPFIQPEQLDLLARCFHNPAIQVATLAKQIHDKKTLFDPNVPKVIFNSAQNAIYFTRAAVPFYRGSPEKDWVKKHAYFKHIGIYAYRSDVLRKVALLPPSPLEIAESLEQLRWLENGIKIHLEITTLETISIDVPADLNKIPKQ